MLFDIVNLVIALGALVLAIFTAYWQHRKVDGLKIVFLSQGARAGKGEGTTALCLTFSVANTGTLPAIVSAAHYVLLHPDEPARQTIILGRDDAGSRFGPHLITAGSLLQIDARFDFHDSEMPKGQLKDHPARLHLEIVNGRGDVVARQLDGFGVAKSESSWITTAPLGKTAILLPKPAVDRSTPFTI